MSTNIDNIYMTESKEGLITAMKAALPFMSEETRDFAACTLTKVERMTEAEFVKLTFLSH